MGPFDRFNDRAKRVLALAQDEAIRFNHDYIGPEHLLLGLVREGEGVAARVLEGLGIQLSAVRHGVESQIGRGDSTTAPSQITLHPRTKKIIEYAIEEARKLGHSHVGTEHLLLGMAREAGSASAQVLGSLGVAFEQVREQTIAVLSGQPRAVDMPTPVARDAEGNRRDWYCEDVLTGKTKVNVTWQDERVMAMEHPYPQYVVHGVVIPKKHVASLMAEEALDGDLLVSMLSGVQAVARAAGMDKAGFQLQANAVAPGVTPHMHWHVLGPGVPAPKRLPQRTQTPAGSAEPTTPPAAVPSTGLFAMLDDSGKRVVALARDEAIKMRHNYIGTEHLLLGLCRGATEPAARALSELGVDLSKVRTAVEFIIGRGQDVTAPQDITMSPRTKKVLELAVDEARKLGTQQAGAEHILLGLVREGEGIASGVIESLGVTLETMRKKVIDLMGRQR